MDNAKTKVIDDKLLTSSEASQYLKIHVNTLMKLVRESKIPYIEMGRKYMFKKDNLDNFLDRKTKSKNQITLEGYSCNLVNCARNPLYEHRRGICPDIDCRDRRWRDPGMKYKKIKLIIEEVE